MIDQNKKSLNDILEDYQKIENELINSNGEISEELEKKLNLHEKELEVMCRFETYENPYYFGE